MRIIIFMNEKEITKQLKMLHFEKAYEMLTASLNKDPLLYSYCLRGLYRLEEALKYARKAPGPKGILEEIKCLFALGQTDAAKVLAQFQYLNHPNNRVYLTYASLLGEIGEVEQALSILAETDIESLDKTSLVEYYVLKGDLLSFQENNEEAFINYDLALKEADSFIPSNWKPLRLMLIHHNIADLYEQLEKESAALWHYEQAKKWMQIQKESDPLITDLYSYEIELLLSSANCYSNADEYFKAKEDLLSAEKLFQQHPPYQKEYVQARIAYISALIEMNEGYDEKARGLFAKALEIQKRLVQSGLDKKEHLARTAYYLASLSDNEEDKKSLYGIACPVFAAVIEKEPTFYLSCLGEIENERGKMEKDEKLALACYDKAIRWYSKLLKIHPDDLLALESLLVCRLNRFKIQMDEMDEIQRELLKIKDYDPAFADSICSYLQRQDLPAAFKDWLQDFENNLPPLFEA